jgi:AcrR family transcriptional regulator
MCHTDYLKRLNQPANLFMEKKKTVTGKRLSPEKRITNILDVAANIITQHGMSAATIERIASDAGISKGLVYNYFPDRIDLLASLLEREHAVTSEKIIGAAESTDDFEHMVRLTNRIYLKHMRDKGALLQRLFSDPSVVEIVNERRKPLKQITTRYLIKLVAEKYGLPANLSKFGIDLSAGLTSAAANYVFTESDVDFQLAEDVCVDMTMAVVRSLASKHNEID